MSKILVISCETTGFGYNYDVTKTSSGYYQPISWGLVVIDHDFNIIDQTYIEVKWDTKSMWDRKAQSIHGLTIEHLQANGLYELQAIEEIGSFIFEHFKNMPVPIMGYNTNFAIEFLNAVFKKYDVQLKFDRKTYDLSTIGFTLLNCNKKSEIFEILGIKSKIRNALVTSLNIIKCFKTIKSLWNAL
jgi:hypothetical protein